MEYVIMALPACAGTAEDFSTELERLAHIACVVLNEHINSDGQCAVCVDVAFPCDRALLAEHNLAVL
jgi:hypothetical protein